MFLIHLNFKKKFGWGSTGCPSCCQTKNVKTYCKENERGIDQKEDSAINAANITELIKH